MGLLWQNLEENYRAWLSKLCTPEDYEGSSIIERSQLRKQFVEEQVKLRSAKREDRAICVSPDVKDNNEEDVKPAPTEIPSSNIKVDTEVIDVDSEEQNEPILVSPEKERRRYNVQERRGWCWLLTPDGNPSMGKDTDSNGLPFYMPGNSKRLKTQKRVKATRNKSRAQKKRRLNRAWNWLVNPDGSPSMGSTQQQPRTTIKLEANDYVPDEMDITAGGNDGIDEPADDIDVKTENTTQETSAEIKVKKEEEHENAKRHAYQTYGDRLLLHRFHGVALLGGGTQSTYQRPSKGSPKIWNGNRLRLGYPLPEMGLKKDANGDNVYDLDAFTCLAYNTLWQINGPKFAGQPTAAVNCVPQYMKDKGLALPVFMKRSLTKKNHHRENRTLGWEYVGNYRCITDEDLTTWESANNVSEAGKHEMEIKYLKSTGYGKQAIDSWRDLLKGKEKEQKEIEDPNSILSRAKALGYKSDMSDKELMHVMVELNEFHEQQIIEFVKYDERIYQFCSKGPTTKNSEGLIQANAGGNIAIAKDWYNFANENMLM